MMRLRSSLRTEFQDFLAMRQASVGKSAYAHDCHYLSNFDIFVADYTREKSISEALINDWLHSRTGKSSTVSNEVVVIRIFLKYLISIGVSAYIPPMPKVADDYVPYLFSDKELERIYLLADNIDVSKARKNPLIRYEFPIVLRLMVGCGLRLGETLALKMKDVNLSQGVLAMLHTKKDKQRLVPMHSTLTEILEHYCLAMGLVGIPDAWLFPVWGKNEPMTPKDAQHCFEKILGLAQISLHGQEKHERGPCLHCLRHVFVFKSFSAAERAGQSVDVSVPYLSTYLGHDSLWETEKYMKFSSELFPGAMEQFSKFTTDVFPEVLHET